MKMICPYTRPKLHCQQDEKLYPTQARIAAKQAEKKAIQEKREQTRAERRKKDKKAVKAESSVKQPEKAPTKPTAITAQSSQERRRLKLEKHLRKAEKLRALLSKAEADSNAQPKTSPDDRTADGEVTSVAAATDPGESAALVDSVKDSPSSITNSSASSESSIDSDSSSSDSSSDDEAGSSPEVVSSKKRLDSKPRISQTVKTRTNIPCKWFARDGHCRRKDCKFLHVAEENRSSRQSLFSKLAEQEINEENIRVLEVIKSLGDDGYLDEP